MTRSVIDLLTIHIAALVFPGVVLDDGVEVIAVITGQVFVGVAAGDDLGRRMPEALRRQGNAFNYRHLLDLRGQDIRPVRT